MYFAGSHLSKSVPIARATSSPFQASVTFFRRGSSAIASSVLLPHEVVVELHERPVP